MTDDTTTGDAEPDAGGRTLTRRGLAGLGAAGLAAGLLPDWAPGANAAQETPFAAHAAAKVPARPNVLFILADDLGWGDLSCYGAPEIRTPHLDRLARGGIRFTNAYSGSSVCSPTRFSLYTGRYPGRLPGGLPEPINAPSKLNGIPVGHPTLGSLLKGRGYRTAMMGKWHCGFLPDFSPTKVGWDEFFGNFGGGLDYFSKVGPLGDYDLYENEVEHHDLRYYTHILTERAERFIATHGDDEPWLLNLNYTTPHWPWEGPRDRAHSRALMARIRDGENPTAVLLDLDGGSLKTYQEMVEDLDRAVGRVLRALDRSGRRKDTLVIFHSDNGGERYSYLWPFTGDKDTLREGGIRVPTIASWPGRLPAGKVSHAPVVTQDWTATLIALAGARPDPRFPLDGTNLVNFLFRGGPAPGKDLFWRLRHERALRRGTLKYYRDPQGTDHLFDVVADPREQRNLASAHRRELGTMRARWEAIAATQVPYPDTQMAGPG